MALYPYSFQAAFDPNTGTAAPRDSVGQVYPVGDTAFANPLPTFDLNGMPVTLTVGEHGYLPDFQVEGHTAVVWKSGEYVFQFATTIPVKGDPGEVGKSAYESAVEAGFVGTEEEWLESLKGANVLPTEEAIASALTTEGPAQTAAKELADASAEAKVAPLAEQVGGLERSATQAVSAVNRAYTVTRVPAGAIPEHVIIRLVNGAKSGGTLQKVVANDSTATVPGLETLRSYYQRTAAPVVVNASANKGDGTFRGLTIVNGQLLRGWEPDGGSGLGIESMVVMRDGSIRVYDQSTAPEQIVADGGWNSFTHAKAIYKNGVATGIENEAGYDAVTGRQAFGNTANGDFIIVSFPGKTGEWGATAGHVKAAVAGMNVVNLYLVDGGGSTQVMVNGEYVVKSTDAAGERAVIDALVFYAPSATKVDKVDWTTIPLAANWEASGDVLEIKREGNLAYMRCTGVFRRNTVVTVPASGDTANTLIGTIPDGLGLRPQGKNAAWHSGQHGRVASGLVGTDGNVFLSNIGGTGDLVVGDRISIYGMWFVN